jgi:hypothetical protein
MQVIGRVSGLTCGSVGFGRPSGTSLSLGHFPGAHAPGYFRASLREERRALRMGLPGPKCGTWGTQFLMWVLLFGTRATRRVCLIRLNSPRPFGARVVLGARFPRAPVRGVAADSTPGYFRRFPLGNGAFEDSRSAIGNSRRSLNWLQVRRGADKSHVYFPLAWDTERRTRIVDWFPIQSETQAQTFLARVYRRMRTPPTNDHAQDADSNTGQ